MDAAHGEELARQVAAGHLARRDLSRQRLSERLRRSGLGEEATERAVDSLVAAGYVDDGRLARSRAEELADRGYGDALIAERLEREGIETTAISEAVGGLAPEAKRARALALGEKDARRLATVLSRRGFSAETVEAACDALAPVDGAGGTELR